jgi:hypothetical protein
LAVEHKFYKDEGRIDLGAKDKLNSAYFEAAVLMATLAGLVTASWSVFFIALVLLVGLALASGDIRR